MWNAGARAAALPTAANRQRSSIPATRQGEFALGAQPGVRISPQSPLQGCGGGQIIHLPCGNFNRVEGLWDGPKTPPAAQIPQRGKGGAGNAASWNTASTFISARERQAARGQGGQPIDLVQAHQFIVMSEEKRPVTGEKEKGSKDWFGTGPTLVTLQEVLKIHLESLPSELF